MAEELGLGILFTGHISKELERSAKSLKKTLLGINTALGKAAKVVKQYDSANKAAAKQASTLEGVIGGLKKSLGANTKEFKVARYAANQLSQKYGNLAQDVRVWSKALFTSSEELARNRLSLKSQGIAVGGNVKANQLFAESVKRVKEQSELGTKAQDKFISKMDKQKAKVVETAANYRQLDNEAIVRSKKKEEASTKATRRFINDMNKQREAEQTKGRETAAGYRDEEIKEKARLERRTKRITRFRGAIARLAATMKTTASYMASGLILGGAFAFAVKELRAVVDYDQALKNLQAIVGATTAEIAIMGEEIRKVAASTKFSAREVGEAMITLGQAGFTATEATEAINAVALLATGTLSSMTSTSDLLTTAIRAFGIETSKSMEVADIFASAVNKSKLTIDKIRISFNFLAPVAHKAGLSIRETTSAMMLLANSGIRASTIGTGLRQVLARLVSPTQKLRTAFQAAGADLEKLNPLTNDFASVIGELSKVITDSGEAFRLFGLRGAPAVAALTAAGTEGFNKMFEQVEKGGVATKMAATQMEGLGVKIKNLMDKLENLAISVGELGLTEAFRILVDVLRALVTVIDFAVKSPFAKIAAVFLAWKIVVAFLIPLLITLKGHLMRYAVTLGIAAHGSAILVKNTVVLQTSFLGLGAVVTRLKAAIMGLKVSMSLLGPAMLVLIWYSVEFVRWTYDAGERAKQAAKKIGENIKALEILTDRLKKATVGSKEYQEIIDELIESHPKLADKLIETNGNIKVQVELVKELTKYQKALHVWKLDIAILNKRFTGPINQTASNLRVSFAKLYNLMVKIKSLGMLDPFKKQMREWDKLSKETIDSIAKDIRVRNAIAKEAGDKDYEFPGWTKAGMIAVKTRMGELDRLEKKAIVLSAKNRDLWFGLDEKSLREQRYLMTNKDREIGDILQLDWEKLYATSSEYGKLMVSNTLTNMDKEREAMRKKNKYIEAGINQQYEVMFRIEKEYYKKAQKARNVDFDEEIKLLREIVDSKKVALDKGKRGIDLQLARGTIKLDEANKTKLSLDKAYFEDILELTWVIYSKIYKVYDKDTSEFKSALAERKEALADFTDFQIETLGNADKDLIRLAEQRAKRIGVAGETSAQLAGQTSGQSAAESIRSVMQERLKYLKEIDEEYKELGASATAAETKIWFAEQRSILAKRVAKVEIRSLIKIEKELWKESERSWESGALSVEKYVAALKRAFDEKVIGKTEFEDKMIVSAGTFWEAWSSGAKKAASDYRTWQQIVQKTSEETLTSMADGLARIFTETKLGTEESKAAFKDWARQILLSISQAIIRAMILRAVLGEGQSGTGGIAGFIATFVKGFLTPSGGDSGGGVEGTFPRQYAHTGGIVGSLKDSRNIADFLFADAKKYHGGGIVGLKNNERPVIVEKKEGIFTQEQMAALAPAGSTNITFEIKAIDGQDVRRMLTEQRPLITGIIQEAYQRKGRTGGPLG